MHSNDIADEINRLAELGLVDRLAERRQSIYRKHVADFSRQLRPRVAQALVLEAEVVAEQWFHSIESMVGWLLASEAEEDSAVSYVNSEQSYLSATSREHILAKVTEISRHRPDAIADEEIEEHAVELAQLLLSNWLCLLEQALIDAPAGEYVQLEYKALPPLADPSALSRGCEAYALAVDDCIAALLAYQDSLVMVNSTVDISADIQLYRHIDGRWYAFRGSSSIMTVLRDLDAAENSPENELEIAYHLMSCRMADHLVPKAISMGASPEIDTEKLKRLVMMAARRVIEGDRKQQRNERVGYYHYAGRVTHGQSSVKNLCKGDRLAKNVGGMVRNLLLGTEDLPHPNMRHSAEWKYNVGELNSADLYLVSVSAIHMAGWITQHGGICNLYNERPNGSAERWLVKSTMRIAEDIRKDGVSLHAILGDYVRTSMSGN